MSRTTQLGFRCTPEVADRLREVAFRRRTSVQAILDEAVNLWFEKGGEKPTGALAGLSGYEEAFVDEFLTALREGDPDLVDSVRQTIKSINRLAAKYARKPGKRAAS